MMVTLASVHGGELLAFPKKECRALADVLAQSVPLPKPFTSKKEWFREGELGIKGEQCRIQAQGFAQKPEGLKQIPGLSEIVIIVTRVLEAQGFKKDKQLDRYKRQATNYRAFARRNDRVTCWANLETVDPAKSAIGIKKKDNSGAKTKGPAQGSKRPPIWRLTVDCFVG
jgi:hypothetical protein